MPDATCILQMHKVSKPLHDIHSGLGDHTHVSCMTLDGVEVSLSTHFLLLNFCPIIARGGAFASRGGKILVRDVGGHVGAGRLSRERFK